MRLPGWLGRPLEEITSNAVRRVLAEEKAGVSDLGALNGPGWESWSLGVRMSGQMSKITTEEQAYRLVSWVNRAVGSLVESTRRATIGVYQPSRREQGRALGWATVAAKAEGAPLSPVNDPLELLRNPLRDYSCGWDELFEQTLGHFLLRGWVGWYCPLSNGKPYLLQVVPRAAVQTITVEDGKLTSYQVKASGGQLLNVKPEELCVLKRWNPQSPLEGLSPIESVMLTADTDRAYTGAIERKARRGSYGLREGFIGVEGDIDEADLRAMRAQMESNYGGPEEAYRIPVLPGSAKWQTTGISARELQFLDVRKFNREEVAGIYGVPPIKMGDWSNSYYNSREQARSFWLDGIEPLLKRTKRFIDSQFLPYWDRNYACDFDTADIAELQEDRKDQVELAARAVEARLMSPNRARAMYLNIEEPYDGGDAVIGSLVGMPIGIDRPPKPSAQGADAQRSVAINDAYRALLLAAGRPRPRACKTFEVPDTLEALTRWWNLLDSIMRPQARRLGQLVQARVASDFIQPVSAAILERASDPAVVLDSGQLTARLAEKSLPLVRAFYIEAGERAEGIAGAKAAKFDLSVERKAEIQRMVDNWALNTSDGLIRQIRDQLELKLAAGVDLVATHDEFIAMLKDLLGSEYRCEMCSRTIVQGANNNATLAGWQGSQVVDGKRWLAGPPSDRRRPVHQEMSGKAEVYGLREDFVLPNGAKGQHPGDIALGLGEVVNCGCVMVAALKALPTGT